MKFRKILTGALCAIALTGCGDKQEINKVSEQNVEAIEKEMIEIVETFHQAHYHDCVLNQCDEKDNEFFCNSLGKGLDYLNNFHKYYQSENGRFVRVMLGHYKETFCD